MTEVLQLLTVDSPLGVSTKADGNVKRRDNRKTIGSNQYIFLSRETTINIVVSRCPDFHSHANSSTPLPPALTADTLPEISFIKNVAAQSARSHPHNRSPSRVCVG